MEVEAYVPGLVDTPTEISGTTDPSSGVSHLVEAFLVLASPLLQSAGDACMRGGVEGQDELVSTTVVAELAYGLDQVVSGYLDDEGLDVEAYGRVQQEILMSLAEDLEPLSDDDPVPDLLDGNGQYDLFAVLEACGNGLVEGHPEGSPDC
jgi:hypothetical protein